MKYTALYLIGYIAFFYIAIYISQKRKTIKEETWWIAFLCLAWPIILPLGIFMGIFDAIAFLAEKRYADHQ